MKRCPICQSPGVSDATSCPRCSSLAALGGASAAARRIGETVAGFVLEDCVARSPLAEVYRGRRGNTVAAVKIYDRVLPESGQDRRIERERAAQHAVDHPCVAPFLDWGTLPDGAAYLASAWVEGRTLEARLEEGPLPWSELAPILHAVARGLHAVHTVEIVHRDLKPSNLLIPASGQPAAVILDFGHSLVLSAERLTDRGQVLGTASYMAPEQASGRALDGRADLYALGVITYRALTGVLPFDNVSPAEVLSQHLLAPVVPPRMRAPGRDIPAAAEDLTLWLLAKDPGARLPNARVLAITLQSLIPARLDAWKESAV